jgi:DNA-binding winged helix-turn-helix (wHTH) protein
MLPTATGMRLYFGDCVFDRETRTLLRGGREVNLSPKAFRLLEALIERRPRAMSKDELQQVLWPDTFVSEGNLPRLVTEVRHATGDSADDPRLIRTVHGFGYAFSGTADEVSERTPDSRSKFAHRLFYGEREIALTEGAHVLGRDPEVAVFLDHPSVSRHHASITITGDAAVLEDLRSKNGTYVNGTRTTAPSVLKDGDDLRVGSVAMVFRSIPLMGSTETVAGG